MARAKTTTRRGAESNRTTASRSSVPKGKLEIGNPRRNDSAKGPLPRAVARQPSRKAAAQLPGEKAVERTDRTVPVEPDRGVAQDHEPLSGAAVDPRRQVVGTDERRDRGRH